MFTKYSLANKDCKKSIQKDKNTDLENLADRAEKAATGGHMRTVYQITKTISRKRSKPTIPAKDEQGKTIFTKEGQIARWQQHFAKLLNRPTPEDAPNIIPARTDLPLNLESPTREEVENAIKHLKSSKAAGPDAIPPEALKTDIKTSSQSPFFGC